MNIFEDLIDELKDENLLEETVVKTQSPKDNPAPAAAKSDHSKDEPAAEILEAEILEAEMLSESPADSFEAAAERKEAEAEFYRKRAMDEVSFLQMVEYVFAGVERDQLKAVPKPYDDLEIKKILHSFLQNSHDPQSPEHAGAQFQLLQETESWHSSLSLRDERILTVHLRRFCEMSRPPLSSPALIALARFYRNSTYSEAVRSKFDLIVTRLFSKEIGGSKREAIFNREELAAHLTELYADWSSVPTYPTDADDAKIAEIVEDFEKFIEEADAAVRFDDLISTGLFNRLHLFKENVNANFFAPPVAAIAVENNVRIGNRYVELLESEKEQTSIADLESKYGFSHDQTISETTGKTYALIELLNQKAVAPPVEENFIARPESDSFEDEDWLDEEETAQPVGLSPTVKRLIGLGAATAAVLLIAVVYFMSGPSHQPEIIIKREASANAQKISLENSLLKDHLEEADIENGTLNGVVLTTWQKQTVDEKIGTATQMLKLGKEKGFSKIQLIDRGNKLVASGTDGNVYVPE